MFIRTQIVFQIGETMNLRKDIETHTLEELKTLYGLPKTKINELLKDNNLSIKYCGRTPYTKSLIPVTDKVISKFQDNKRRMKTNKEFFSEETNWPESEIKTRRQDIQELDYKIGYLYAELNKNQQKINELLQRRNDQQFMVSICEKTKETKDYCGFFEEERYGKRPEIEKLNVPQLTDGVVLGYLSTKISPQSLSCLYRILTNKEVNYNEE